MSRLGRFALFVLVAGLMSLGLEAIDQANLVGTHNGTPTATSSLNIVFVSGSSPSPMATQTVNTLVSRASGSLTTVSEVADLPGISGLVDRSSIVVFDSDWLAGKAQDAALAAFFKTVLPKQAKIVSIGSSTSLLFDALREVNGQIFADGRNPAASNPMLAGYKMKGATAPDGTPYFGDSILIGNTAIPASAADAILAWG